MDNHYHFLSWPLKKKMMFKMLINNNKLIQSNFNIYIYFRNNLLENFIALKIKFKISRDWGSKLWELLKRDNSWKVCKKVDVVYASYNVKLQQYHL